MCWWLNLNAFLVISGLQTKIEVSSFHASGQSRTFCLCRVTYCLPPAVSLLWDCQQMIPCHLKMIQQPGISWKHPALYVGKGQNPVLTVNLPVLGLLKYSLCIGGTGQCKQKGRNHRTIWASGDDRRQNPDPAARTAHGSVSSLCLFPWDKNLPLNLKVTSHIAAAFWEKAIL